MERKPDEYRGDILLKKKHLEARARLLDFLARVEEEVRGIVEMQRQQQEISCQIARIRKQMENVGIPFKPPSQGEEEALSSLLSVRGVLSRNLN